MEMQNIKPEGMFGRDCTASQDCQASCFIIMFILTNLDQNFIVGTIPSKINILNQKRCVFQFGSSMNVRSRMHG